MLAVSRSLALLSSLAFSPPALAEKTGLQVEKLLVNLDKIESDAPKKYLSYEEVFSFYSHLAKSYPKWIKIYAASELYPASDNWEGDEAGRLAWQQKMSGYKCGSNFVDIHGSNRKKVDGDQPCETLLVGSLVLLELSASPPPAQHDNGRLMDALSFWAGGRCFPIQSGRRPSTGK